MSPFDLIRMNPSRKAYLELHFAVLLFGFTAIFGSLIHLNALVLVWWRVFLTALSLVFFIPFRRLVKELPRKNLLQLMGIGVIVALHWITFYGAIKLSNTSVGVVALATITFFTAFLEPLLTRQPLKWFEVGLSLLILPGVALVVNNTDFSMAVGFGVGMSSALFASIFTILNKKQIGILDPLSITFIELSSACLFLTIVLPISIGFTGQIPVLLPPTLWDWGFMLILAVVCTTLGYVLALNALKYISAFASNLALNLEPVYGVALAWLLLNENKELKPGFYWGAAIIGVAVFSYPLLRDWLVKKDVAEK